MLATLFWNLVRGFSMGAADIVPGVSGGTVALVLGIYERLIASIRAGSIALGRLLRADVAGFRTWMATVEWTLVLPLGAGILLAVLSLAGLLQQLLHDEAELMAALFLGLVAGSVVVAWQLMRAPRLGHVVIVLGVAAVTFVALGLQGGTTDATGGRSAEPELWAFFVAGAIAICAMILPGISGSFLLVLMGMYAPVLAAVTDRDVVVLGVFLAGIVVGLALFSQILHYGLRHHHDSMLAALIGLMAGSTRVLWPWPNGVDSTELGGPEGDVLLALVSAVVGFALVVVVGRIAQRYEVSEEERMAPVGATASPSVET